MKFAPGLVARFDSVPVLLRSPKRLVLTRRNTLHAFSLGMAGLTFGIPLVGRAQSGNIASNSLHIPEMDEGSVDSNVRTLAYGAAAVETKNRPPKAPTRKTAYTSL